MTRLVYAQRRQMIHDILADLPNPDYEESIRRRALILAEKALPPKARDLWKDANTRGLLHTHAVYFSLGDGSNGYPRYVSVALPGFDDDRSDIKQDSMILGLLEAYRQWRDKRDLIERDLKNNFASVTTHEEFVKRWPELAKYLPDGSEAKAENLPATTALLDELKEAGLDIAA